MSNYYPSQPKNPSGEGHQPPTPPTEPLQAQNQRPYMQPPSVGAQPDPYLDAPQQSQPYGQVPQNGAFSQTTYGQVPQGGALPQTTYGQMPPGGALPQTTYGQMPPGGALPRPPRKTASPARIVLAIAAGIVVIALVALFANYAAHGGDSEANQDTSTAANGSGQDGVGDAPENDNSTAETLTMDEIKAAIEAPDVPSWSIDLRAPVWERAAVNCGIDVSATKTMGSMIMNSGKSEIGLSLTSIACMLGKSGLSADQVDTIVNYTGETAQEMDFTDCDITYGMLAGDHVISIFPN